MRRRAFPGYGQEVDTKYERAGNWLLATIYRDDNALMWCKINGVPVQRAAGESIGAAGAFLIPVELSRAILDLRDQYGAFRRRARIIPMASSTTSVPRRPGGAGAFFFGENTGATETNVKVDELRLTAKKIGSLVKVSSELEEDSLISIVDTVANEIAFAFAAQEDDCGFNGDGTSGYGTMVGVAGIIASGQANKSKVTAASGHNTYLTLDGTDLTNLMNAVQAAAIPNAAWFCSQTAFAQTFCRLSAGGGYLWTAMVDGIVTPFYLGFPVILTQKLPLISTTLTGKLMLAFGDMYLAGALGERRAITLARSDERYIDQDQIGILGTERFHTVIHGMGDNTNFGALAALVAP